MGGAIGGRSDRSGSKRSPVLISDYTVEGIGRVAVAIGGRSDRTPPKAIAHPVSCQFSESNG